MFTDEEVKAAKATRDAIISENISELKSIYMAGEIVMWDEMRAKNLQQAHVIGRSELLLAFVKWRNEKKNNWLKHINESEVDEFIKASNSL